ncbi:MAG: hypothetical protein J5873_04680 [Bacteroidales bacterium]|nr:hypothetical protein [Bacteroidales bacterium]
MKKLLFIVLTVFTLTSCVKSPENCYQCKADQIFNAKTEVCDCVQPFPESERPVLKTDGYNFWDSVCKYFTYSVSYKNPETYPYYSHEGDTLLLCGWIDHTPLEKRVYSRDSTLVKISLMDDSVSAAMRTSSNDLNCIACPVSLLGKIDMDKMAYLKGIITFSMLNVGFFELNSPADPDKDCVIPYYAFKVLEIKNLKE